MGGYKVSHHSGSTLKTNLSLTLQQIIHHQISHTFHLTYSIPTLQRASYSLNSFLQGTIFTCQKNPYFLKHEIVYIYHVQYDVVSAYFYRHT